MKKNIINITLGIFYLAFIFVFFSSCSKIGNNTINYKIQFEESTIELNVGDKCDLPKAYVYKIENNISTLIDVNCYYNSFDETIVKINSNGQLIGTGIGTTYVEAAYETASEKFEVIVNELTLDKTAEIKLVTNDENIDDFIYTIDENNKYIIFPTIEKKGYVLDYWTDGTNQYTGGKKVGLAIINKTFEAVWKLKEYKINYVLNGGVNSLDNKNYYTIEDEIVVLQYPSKENSDFVGWYEDEQFIKPITYINPLKCEDISIYAKFINKYLIKYSSDDESKNNYYKDNEEITIEECSFVKKGYSFAGWSDGSKVYMPGEKYIVNKETNFSAIWNSISYSIKYELAEGTNNTSNPTNYTIEENSIQLYAPTKSGYAFEGWYLNQNYDNKIESIDTSLCKDICLYAKFLKIYSAFFTSTKGVELEIVDISEGEGRKIELPSNNYQYDYGDFIGWSDGVNIYKPKDLYTLNKNTTFTAVWQDKIGENNELFSLKTNDYIICYSQENGAYEASLDLAKSIKKTLGKTINPISELKLNFYDITDDYIISIGNTNIYSSLDHIVYENEFLSVNELNQKLIKENSFTICSSHYSLFFNGVDEFAIRYSINQFVEDVLNTRYLTPTYTYYDKLDDAFVSIQGKLYEPDFTNREYLNYGTYFSSISENKEYAYHLRDNGEFVETKNYLNGKMNWYTDKDISLSHNTLKLVNPENYKDYTNTMFFSNSTQIIDIEYTDGITDDGCIDRSTQAIDTAAEAMYQGVYNLLKNTTQDHFYLSVGQEDTNECCTCEKCIEAIKKYNRSGIIIRFWNAIINELQKSDVKDKDYKLIMFAYQYDLLAPTIYPKSTKNGKIVYDLTKEPTIDPTCIPNERLYVRIAPLLADRYLSLEDENAGRIQRQDGRQEYSKMDYSIYEGAPYYSLGHMPINTIYSDWHKVTNNLFTWIYPTSYTSIWTYMGFTNSIKQNILMFKKYGIDYVFVQGTYLEQNHVDQYLEAYITSKLLWDSSLDVIELRNEYIRLYYGNELASSVINYYDSFDNEYASLFNTGIGIDGGNIITTLSENFLLNQKKTIDDAINLTTDDNLKQRLELLRLTPYFMLAKKNESYRNDFLVQFQNCGCELLGERTNYNDYIW